MWPLLAAPFRFVPSSDALCKQYPFAFFASAYDVPILDRPPPLPSHPYTRGSIFRWQIAASVHRVDRRISSPQTAPRNSIWSLTFGFRVYFCCPSSSCGGPQKNANIVNASLAAPVTRRSVLRSHKSRDERVGGGEGLKEACRRARGFVTFNCIGGQLPQFHNSLFALFVYFYRGAPNMQKHPVMSAPPSVNIIVLLARRGRV